MYKVLAMKKGTDYIMFLVNVFKSRAEAVKFIESSIMNPLKNSDKMELKVVSNAEYERLHKLNRQLNFKQITGG